MALKKDFYEEIYKEEINWIEMLNAKLLNVYYLLELRKFYYERQVIVSHEYNLTLNPIMKSIWTVLNNMVEKLDHIDSDYKMGKRINLNELKNYFLINILSNNVEIPLELRKNSENKKNLYELRNKIINEGAEDYIDDDFYYENHKVA